MTSVATPAPERDVPGGTRCRFCGGQLDLSVVDLGLSPLCEMLVRPDQLEEGEAFYPLHVRACRRCWLVQIPEFVAPRDIFTEYAYFSSFSSSWLGHAQAYVDMIAERCSLGDSSFVVELGSNDGYLLQAFLPKRVPVLGVEPAANVAEAAVARGIPTLVAFFGGEVAAQIASEHRRADLIVGNNVLAQVPDLNDFVAGVETLLAPGGTATFEVPHVATLLESVEYDTIYHEHFSYFSLYTLGRVFSAHGLQLVDVEELPTHGGSLRVFAAHTDDDVAVSPAVTALLAREESLGLRTPEPYARFGEDVRESKRALLELLIGFGRDGKQVAGYGAPGKGNTLLNYCGIRTDLLEYTVDRNPYKHGLFTPGTRIPIHPPERIDETKPDVIVILPWNLVGEITRQLSHTADWGAQLVVPVPMPTVFAPGELPSEARFGWVS